MRLKSTFFHALLSRTVMKQIFLTILATLFCTSVFAERGIEIKPTFQTRTALVIGNGAYDNAPLENPVNDARDIAAVLKDSGFAVSLKVNATQREMDDAIMEFGRDLRQSGVGLFYYAGHGIQVQGRNFLIPVGATVETESDVKYNAVDAGKVLGKMEDAGNDINIVILDACRNNPFSRSFRSAEMGLARMDSPKGSLIAYATSPGSVAADGDGRNGIFTKHLIDKIKQPSLDVEDVLGEVRIAVAKETEEKQIPWTSTSLMGKFYFNTGGGNISVSVSQPQKQETDPEKEMWQMVKETGSIADVQMFLDAYPNGHYVNHAKLRMAQLQRQEDKLNNPRIENETNSGVEETSLSSYTTSNGEDIAPNTGKESGVVVEEGARRLPKEKLRVLLNKRKIKPGAKPKDNNNQNPKRRTKPIQSDI